MHDEVGAYRLFVFAIFVTGLSSYSNHLITYCVRFIGQYWRFVSAAVIIGIGFSGLAVCLIIVCCGVVCLYRSIHCIRAMLASEKRLLIINYYLAIILRVGKNSVYSIIGQFFFEIPSLSQSPENFFIANFLEIVKVKEFRKSARIWWNSLEYYRLFFQTRCRPICILGQRSHIYIGWYFLIATS